MRGTTYAISEIVWWMLAALAIGISIGWLLRRWFAGGARLKDVQAELEAKSVRYAELSGELGGSKLAVERLNRDLEARAGELTAATDRAGELEASLSSVRGELDAANSTAGDLEASLAATRADLESATARTGELESQLGAVAAEKDAAIASLGSSAAGLESAVAEREARVAELEARAGGVQADLERASAELSAVQAAHADCTVAAEANTGRIAGLESALAEREARIEELEAIVAAQAARSGAAEADVMAAESADLEGLAAAEESFGDVAGAAAVAPSVPPTRFGTAGADHTDDLKVINGIGPKMEELLNSFGIRAWDQLAALSPSEVARVDAALEEFPGRIERDQWVDQARDLVRRFPDPTTRPDRDTFSNEAPS